MSTIVWVLLSTFFVSLIAWIGVLTFFLKDELLERILLVLVALSGGALLGGAFLHLLPKAISQSQGPLINIFLSLLIGFCVFLILEEFINWHHHHSTTHKKKPVSYLILISDMLHNFIDGLVIAGSFLIGISVGTVTTLAIVLHEIPQEIGDFGILIYGGFEKTRALTLNFASALTVILGGIVGYWVSGIFENAALYLLPFAAGNFIYIASSDLVPEIKHGESLKKSFLHLVIFLLGILLMLGIKLL